MTQAAILALGLLGWCLLVLLAIALARSAAKGDHQLEQTDEARAHFTIYTPSGKVHTSRRVGTHG